MAKVRFELNIDEIIERPIDVSSNDELFKTQDATNKTFLFIDKMTGMMQAAYCRRAATADAKYAQIDYFPIPNHAVIIDEDVKDHKHEALMSHIQDCCDKVCKTAQYFDESNASRYNGVKQSLKGLFDVLEEVGTGNGISEKTLLDALRIVSKQTE